jgi:predicted nucleic acid-binding protein
LLSEDLIVTAGIIKVELLSGTRTEAEFNRLRDRLTALSCIETDHSLWDMACGIGFKLRRKGVTMPYTDILIGACALSGNCTLLHADHHFDLMADYFDIQSESFVNAVSKINKNRP